MHDAQVDNSVWRIKEKGMIFSRIMRLFVYSSLIFPCPPNRYYWSEAISSGIFLLDYLVRLTVIREKSAYAGCLGLLR